MALKRRLTTSVDDEPPTALVPPGARPPVLPSVECIQQELASASSMDDFFGKEGIFARLFATTLEQMLEVELTAHLGYQPYAAEGRNSGNSRNGKRGRQVRSSGGDVTIQVPRDRNSSFQSPLLEPYQSSTNELEEKIIGLYAKGISTRDIQETLRDLYGVEVTPTTISTITDKVWSLVEAWQNRPLATIYPIVFLDALHLKLRRDGKVVNTAIYIVLGVDLDGQRDVLGHWVGDGAEGANFWLSVVTDLQARGVADIFIACVDGLTGFKAAIQAVFPQTHIQRCVIHQVRHSLNYVSWKDKAAFANDMKAIYQAPTREAAEAKLLRLGEKWNKHYAIAVRSWESNWEDLTTMFDYPPDIRRLIYTTNNVESYNGQLRKVTKTKGAFPSAEAVRKLLFLVTRNITRKWTMPVLNWASILNQLAIRFADRFPI
jgi:transposase-like protein